MQQFHQNSLSPLIIIGDVDNLDEDLKSKHTPEKSPSYLKFNNEKIENTEKKENIIESNFQIYFLIRKFKNQFKNYSCNNNLMIKKYSQHSSDFTDLLYLWNDYLINKFEKNNRLQ